MAAHNFNPSITAFNAEYRLEQRMQMLTDTLAQVQGANGQPLIPNDPGTPLNNLIRELNLQPAAAAPPFDFELDNHVTIEMIQAECIQRNVNIFNVTRNLGARAFYHMNYGAAPAAGQPPNNNPWREYSRPEVAEKSVEWQQVSFLGDSTTVVDWAQTIPALKRLFLARVYTNDMAKICLMHLVQKYHPEQAILLRTHTANQIATFLLQLDSNRDKRTYHRMQLFKMVRTPEEDLPAAMAKVQLIINAIYPENDPAYTAHRSSTVRTAVISFCSDTVAAAVLELIRYRQAECLPLTDDEIRNYAIRYENYTHNKPTTNLIFGRTINNIPAANFIQLNSMRMATHAIDPHYPLFPSPDAHSYSAIPGYDQQKPVLLQNMQNPHQIQQIQQMLPSLQPNLQMSGFVPLNPFANVQMPIQFPLETTPKN